VNRYDANPTFGVEGAFGTQNKQMQDQAEIPEATSVHHVRSYAPPPPAPAVAVPMQGSKRSTATEQGQGRTCGAILIAVLSVVCCLMVGLTFLRAQLTVRCLPVIHRQPRLVVALYYSPRMIVLYLLGSWEFSIASLALTVSVVPI